MVAHLPGTLPADSNPCKPARRSYTNLVFRPRGKGEEPLAILRHLKAWRLAAGLTQEELALQSHVHISTISRIENRPLEHPCHLNLVHRLGETLGVANHTLINCEPPAERLPANWAFGCTYRITEEQCRELRFRCPFLHIDLATRELTVDDLATQTGIDANELAAIYEDREGATVGQLQLISVALGSPILSLIRC